MIYDFRCTEGHITEHYVEAGVTQVRCECGAPATRIISGCRFHLKGSDDGFPTAHDRWVREHENAGKLKQELHNT